MRGLIAPTVGDVLSEYFLAPQFPQGYSLSI